MARTSHKEQRRHRRLEIHLPLEYRRAGLGRCNVARTTTQNVSTGGVYFETTVEDIERGEVLALEFGVPEGDPRFPTQGKISTSGRVVRMTRIEETGGDGKPAFTRYGVAAEFQQPFKLVF